MTYNFDPDRWYEDQRLRLDFLRRNGELPEDAYQASVADLDRRHEEMLRRLDNTFELRSGGRKADKPLP